MEQGLTPTLDVKENEKEIVVKADLPGIDEKDIDLTIHDGVLSLRGEKKSERTRTSAKIPHVMERSYGFVQRSIRLPETIDEDKVDAHFDKGVYDPSRFPKAARHGQTQKKIEIKGA